MMKNRKKYVMIAAIAMVVFILVVLILQTNREIEKIEDKGEIGVLIGRLSIDCIGIENVEVRNGVNKATLEKAIGMYENRDVDLQAYNGNICMFSYSSGEKESYFFNLKNIRIGDRICYETNNEVSYYAVYQIDFWSQSNTSYLKATQDNIITLVTSIPSNNTNLVVRGYKMEK